MKDKGNQQNDHKSTSMGKRLLKIFWLLVFLFVAVLTPYLFMDDAKYLYQKYLVNDHKELVIYLDNINHINNSGEEITRNVRLKLYRLTAQEYDTLVSKGQRDLQRLIEDVNLLSPPNEFNEHKNTVIDVLNQHILVLANYQEAKKTNLYENLNISINELNNKNELERKTLFNSFKKAKIEYKQLEDGTFRFWYKQNSAIPLKND